MSLGTVPLTEPDAAGFDTELPRNSPKQALSKLPAGHRISLR
jgi:hypothetical protein